MRYEMYLCIKYGDMKSELMRAQSLELLHNMTNEQVRDMYFKAVATAQGDKK